MLIDLLLKFKSHKLQVSIKEYLVLLETMETRSGAPQRMWTG